MRSRAWRGRSRSWGQTWRRVLYSARTSVIITVALVPPFIDQLLRIVGEVSPWLVSAILAGLGIVVFWFLARRELALDASRADDGVASRITNEDWIESLICTVNLPVPLPDRPTSVQTLIRQLPSLRAVRLIFSETARVEEAKASLREWVATHVGREVAIDAIALRLDPFELSDVQIDQLAAELKHTRAQNLAVDVTGGTKVMTVATYQAAIAANLPVTYMIQRADHAYAGLSSLSDPDGVFAHRE